MRSRATISPEGEEELLTTTSSVRLASFRVAAATESTQAGSAVDGKNHQARRGEKGFEGFGAQFSYRLVTGPVFP